ncbi:hypothetical protein ABE545_16720 [Sphingobacterium faecium]|jgi:hypothetical protein|uniref:hypothetical protein n=1 Tax=Sphingobacterium faecium TaxID=34087 RepID=UPI00320B1E91
MKAITFIKQHALAMVAVATIVTFSAFKATGVDIQQARYTLAVYFHGNPENPAEVEDESKWTTTPNLETCDGANTIACMQLVEHSDLTASDELDPAKITLGSQNTTGLNYIPTRTGGSSLTAFRPINRS